MQFTLYGIGAVPILTTLISTFLTHDILIIMLIDLGVVTILSKVTESLITKTSQSVKNEYASLESMAENNRNIVINWAPSLIVLLVCLFSHIALWIAGLSFEENFYSLMPVIENGWARFFYYLIFFFTFSTVYPAIESKLYYSDILKHLTGNYIQSIIVGLLAFSKAVIVIIETVNREPIPLTILICIWLVLNLTMAYYAFGHNYYINGSISRQLSHILILVGWILLFHNPLKLNSRPNHFYKYHPKNILG